MYSTGKPPSRNATTAETIGCGIVAGLVLIVLCGLASWVAVAVLG